jgi:hypothetical protein
MSPLCKKVTGVPSEAEVLGFPPRQPKEEENSLFALAPTFSKLKKGKEKGNLKERDEDGFFFEDWEDP